MASISSKRAAKILSNVGIELPKDVAPGRETIAFLQESLGKEYDKLSPFIRGSVDKTFSNAVAALRTKALQGGGPERLAAWSDVEAAVKQFNSKKGAFDGEGYKELTGRLEIIAEKLAKDGKDVAALDVAQAADGIKDQALTLVGRNNPAAYRRLKRIDRSYAQFKTEQRASLAGPVRSEHGVTTPEDTLAAMQNRDTSIDKGEFAAGKIPGQKEVETLRDVTGGRPAKRGSILQTTGVSYVAGAGFVATLGALAYSPGVKRVTQAIIDGKGGATPKAIEQSLQKTSAGRRILRTLDADARQKLYTQLIREKTRESAQD